MTPIERLTHLTTAGDLIAARELLTAAHRASDTTHRLLALDAIGRRAWTHNDPSDLLDWLLKVTTAEALAVSHRVRPEWFGAEMKAIPSSLGVALHRFRHGVQTTDTASAKVPLHVERCRKPGKGKRLGPPIRGGWSLLAEVNYYQHKDHETLAEYAEAVPVVLVQVSRKADGRLVTGRVTGGIKVVAKRGDPVEWGNRVFMSSAIARTYTNLYKEKPDDIFGWGA